VANIFVAASATWNGKALKKAKQDVGVFDKQVKKLGGTLAAAFSVRALTSFGKASVKMALQSQAEQERLANLLKVTTGARQQSIAVLNDQAIALEKIGVVTAGSITQTQSQLATFDLQLSTIEKLTPAILDYVTAEKGATASAADFKSMTNGLAQALNGNFASLTKTGFVLDDFTKKTIKEGTETERAAALVKVLNSTYKDFNKNLRQTNAGKMQVLANTANDVKVTIGTGILDALTLLSNDNTIDNLASSMQDFATATSEVIVGLGKVAEKLKALNVPGLGNIFDVRNIPVIGAYIGGLRQIGRGAMPQQDRGGQERTASRINAQQRKLEAKAIKNSVALRKAENDQLKKKTAVDQLKDKFDLERIGITAALNAATDQEVKLRLRSQLAILDNNEALAKKLLAEMEAAEGLKKFTNELASSTDKFSTMVSKLVNEFMAMGLSFQEASALAHMSARYQAQADAFAAGGSVSGMSIPSSIAPLNKIPSGAINPQQQFTNSAILSDLLRPATVQQSQYIMDSMSARYQAQADAYFAKQQQITLTIDTANTGDRFNQLIAESIQAAAKTGLSLSPVGSLP
jgi:hypothetical protein